MLGPQASASASCLTGNFTGGRGASLRWERRENLHTHSGFEFPIYTVVSDCNCTPEGVGLGVPGELSTDGVGNGGDKLSTKPEVCTQESRKLLGTVARVGDVPFKLVHQRNVPHMYVELVRDNHLTHSFMVFIQVHLKSIFHFQSTHP